MKRLLVVLLLLLIAASGVRADDPAARGPHEVARLDLPVRTALGSKIPVEVFLPKDAKGPAPVIFISHGWTDEKSSFEWRAQHYASRGFAAVLVEQPFRQEIDLKRWSRNVRETIDAVESAAKEGPLAGKVDLERIGLEGHSYGGSTAILTASLDPRVKAVVALAPGAPLYHSDVLEAAKNLTVPLHVQAAQVDTVVPAPIFARQPFDDADGSPHRLYIEIQGAHHLSWSDNPLLRPWRGFLRAMPRFFQIPFIVDLDDTVPISLRYSTAWFEEKLGVRSDRGSLLEERVPGLSEFKGARLAAAREDTLGKPARTPGIEGALQEKMARDRADRER